MTKKMDFRRNEGFTLIEIIAVLIILGILAAVAIPKFVDLQDEAKKKSAEGLVAAAQSQISMGYAKEILNAGDEANGWANLVTNLATICAEVETSGYTSASITCAEDSDVITINASVDGSEVITGYFNRPD